MTESLPPARTARKRGRPRLVYDVELTAAQATAKVQPASLRGKIVAYLRGCGGRAHITDLEVRFGTRTCGTVIKLRRVGWVRRV